MTPEPPGILYCNCTYAQVIPASVKTSVLRQLCDSGRSFETVADLCEMSARADPVLARLAASPGLKVAACHPRAVKWLFSSAGCALDAARTEVVNLRELSAATAGERLLASDLAPNLPPDKVPVRATG